MKENKIIDFLIGKHNIFQKMLFIYRLKKEKVTYDTIWMYLDFLDCLERMFYYNNSKDSPIYSFTTKDTLQSYLILGSDKYQIYVSPQLNRDLHIRIYRYQGNRIDSNLTFCYDKIDKVTRYDRFVVEDIFRMIKNEIINLIKQYIKRV